MRRMITEKDVEKLDSIKPSEIEKLGAMQDPKTAKANQLLTADGTGKAVYKDAPSSGTTIGVWFDQASFFYEDFHADARYPGYKVCTRSTPRIIRYAIKGLPNYTKADNTTRYLTPADGYILDYGKNETRLAIPEALFTQFEADTAGESNRYINFPIDGLMSYSA